MRPGFRLRLSGGLMRVSSGRILSRHTGRSRAGVFALIILTTTASGAAVAAQCHVEERDRVFRAGAALFDAAGGLFDGE
jgi:hypothetical protein